MFKFNLHSTVGLPFGKARLHGLVHSQNNSITKYQNPKSLRFRVFYCAIFQTHISFPGNLFYKILELFQIVSRSYFPLSTISFLSLRGKKQSVEDFRNRNNKKGCRFYRGQVHSQFFVSSFFQWNSCLVEQQFGGIVVQWNSGLVEQQFSD